MNSFLTAIHIATPEGITAKLLNTHRIVDGGKALPIAGSPLSIRLVRNLPRYLAAVTVSFEDKPEAFEWVRRYANSVLVDPNTGVALFESLEIIEYLDAVYTVAN